jgi:chaperonin GroES
LFLADSRELTADSPGATNSTTVGSGVSLQLKTNLQEDLMPATATKSKPKSKVTLQPIGDKVVVERDETEEKTAGGIYIPDTAKDKPTRGTIIAVGTGKLLDDGSRGEMQVKKGDRVLFTSYAPETINIGDDEYLLMSESDILAVIE